MLEYVDTIIAYVAILLGISLFITILNQMISAFLGYRGTNLLWGVRTLLSTIEPNLENDAEAIAKKILTNRIFSDSIFSKFGKIPVINGLVNRWKLASAISPAELIHGLRSEADKLRATDSIKANTIYELIEEVDPEAARKAQLVSTAFNNLAPNYAIQVDNVIKQAGAVSRESVGKVEAWFDIAIKRASQRFTVKMRLFTVVLAVCIAALAHLDSFRIVQQLWTSPGLRSTIVSNRDAFLKEAVMVLPPEENRDANSKSNIAPQVLVDSMKKLLQTEKDVAGLGAVPSFNSMDEALNWLRASANDESRKNVLADEYKNLVMNELKMEGASIRLKMEESGFQLIPKPYPGFNYKLSEIPGILVTACFLSLGAPFWFNILKALSNLRPLFAVNQEQQQG